MAVQAVMGLMDDFLPRVRFQLSESKEWIETTAQVVWANEARKLLGLRFAGSSGAIPADHPGMVRARAFRKPRPRPQTKTRTKTPEAPGILAEGLEGRIMPPAPMLVMPSPPDFSTRRAPKPPCRNRRTLRQPRQSIMRLPLPPPKEWAVPALTFPPESFRAPASNDLPDKWSVAVFFLFLATASLAAGWAVGRGTLGLRNAKACAKPCSAKAPLAALPRLIPRRSSRSRTHRKSRSSTSTVIRWTIPLTASALVAGTQASAGAGSSAIPGSPEHEKANQSFRTWVLTAPVQPKAKPAAAPMPRLRPP